MFHAAAAWEESAYDFVIERRSLSMIPLSSLYVICSAGPIQFPIMAFAFGSNMALPWKETSNISCQQGSRLIRWALLVAPGEGNKSW
jgi:hypothetical protein